MLLTMLSFLTPLVSSFECSCGISRSEKKLLAQHSGRVVLEMRLFLTSKVDKTVKKKFAAGDGVLHDLGGGRGDGGGADRQVRHAAVPVDEDVPPVQAVLRTGGGRPGLRYRGQRQHGGHRARLGVQPLPAVRRRQRRPEVIYRRLTPLL
jgi:hypothetical protein